MKGCGVLKGATELVLLCNERMSGFRSNEGTAGPGDTPDRQRRDDSVCLCRISVSEITPKA